MLDFEDLKSSFEDFSIKDFSQRKPFIFTIICLIVFLFLSGLIVLLIQTKPEKKSKEKAPEYFKSDAPVLIPDPPYIEKDYFPTRTTENEWTKAEINKWFTYPDDNVMQSLENANDKIADEITGAAP